jgi:hypothetical protein
MAASRSDVPSFTAEVQSERAKRMGWSLPSSLAVLDRPPKLSIATCEGATSNCLKIRLTDKAIAVGPQTRDTACDQHDCFDSASVEPESSNQTRGSKGGAVTHLPMHKTRYQPFLLYRELDEVKI